MYLNENEWQRFLGTGAVSADGDNLSAFLQKYDPNKYQNPCNTVDTLVFTYQEQDGIRKISRLLLIRRGNHPSIGWWALPGGFVEYREDIDQAALRELQEETGIEDIEVCQLKCYGAYDRDPRTRIITTAYAALVPEGSLKAAAGDDASDAGWFEIEDTILNETADERYQSVQHRLVLRQPETGITTTSIVEVKSRIGGILPNVNYKVLETNLLAADHGAIILEGYHFVKGLLDRQTNQSQADKM